MKKLETPGKTGRVGRYDAIKVDSREHVLHFPFWLTFVWYLSFSFWSGKQIEKSKSSGTKSAEVKQKTTTTSSLTSVFSHFQWNINKTFFNGFDDLGFVFRIKPVLLFYNVP